MTRFRPRARSGKSDSHRSCGVKRLKPAATDGDDDDGVDDKDDDTGDGDDDGDDETAAATTAAFISSTCSLLSRSISAFSSASFRSLRFDALSLRGFSSTCCSPGDMTAAATVVVFVAAAAAACCCRFFQREARRRRLDSSGDSDPFHATSFDTSKSTSSQRRFCSSFCFASFSALTSSEPRITEATTSARTTAISFMELEGVSRGCGRGAFAFFIRFSRVTL